MSPGNRRGNKGSSVHATKRISVDLKQNDERLMEEKRRFYAPHTKDNKCPNSLKGQKEKEKRIDVSEC